MLLPLLKRKKANQAILIYVKEHSGKSGTPTMGGIAFVLASISAGLLFCGEKSQMLLTIMAVFVGYALIGFLDDYIKIRYKQNQGLRAYQKIAVQLLLAAIVAFFVEQNPLISSELRLPFTNGDYWQVNAWIIPLVAVIFLACTNGVNLTDGLDGLASSVTVIYVVGLTVLTSMEIVSLNNSGSPLAAEYESINTLNFALVGALVAFLLFNCFPARIFMGDVGSLSLGAYVACVSIFTRRSLYIPILGIVYVISCVSVIVQVAYFKLTKGKRVFLMAPYHHHLQQKGLSETRIAVIYSTITLLAALILICGE